MRPWRSSRTIFAISGFRGVSGSSRSKKWPLDCERICLARVVFPHCLGPVRMTTGNSFRYSSMRLRLRVLSNILVYYQMLGWIFKDKRLIKLLSQSMPFDCVKIKYLVVI